MAAAVRASVAAELKNRLRMLISLALFCLAVRLIPLGNQGLCGW
jgi:hypothetical protein